MLDALDLGEAYGHRSQGLAVGLNSGTSADGIDATLVAFAQSEGEDQPRFLLRGHHHAAFSAADRARIQALNEPDAPLVEVALWHVELGRRFGRAARALLEATGTASAEVRVVGSHGQTIAHYPHGVPGGPDGLGVTVQIGDASHIASITGIGVVSDFRSRDVAVGGQGAPIGENFDHAAFRDAREDRIVLNIGGIANITVLPAACTLDDVVAFDTGPGNMILDAAAARLTGGRLGWDADGRMAATGRIDAGLLTRWLEHPYFARLWPKTTGREEFGHRYSDALLADAAGARLCPEDTLATLTALVGRTIAQGVAQALPGRPIALIASGGGVKNPVLMGRLASELPLLRPWQTTAPYGIPVEAKESMAFAYLAWQFLEGRPTNVPSASGARSYEILGHWTPPPYDGHRRPAPSSAKPRHIPFETDTRL